LNSSLDSSAPVETSLKTLTTLQLGFLFEGILLWKEITKAR